MSSCAKHELRNLLYGMVTYEDQQLITNVLLALMRELKQTLLDIMCDWCTQGGITPFDDLKLIN